MKKAIVARIVAANLITASTCLFLADRKWLLGIAWMLLGVAENIRLWEQITGAIQESRRAKRRVSK